MSVSARILLTLIRVCFSVLLIVVSLSDHTLAADSAAPATTPPTATEPAKEAPKEPAKTGSGSDASIPNNDELLAEQVPADQIWWLNADSDKFLGLYIAEETGRDGLGAVLILPDPGRPADWPAITRTLRELLPKYRWSTLAISPSTTNSALQPRIDAAIKQLRSKNINNIAVIAEGKTALGALEFIQLHAGQVSAVVLLNPAHEAVPETTTNDGKSEPKKDNEKTATEKPANAQTAGMQDPLLSRISTLAIPCLDMAIDSSSEGMALAAERLNTSRKLKPGQYQQVSLPPNDRFGINDQESPITKRIRGWLGKNAVTQQGTK